MARKRFSLHYLFICETIVLLQKTFGIQLFSFYYQFYFFVPQYKDTIHSLLPLYINGDFLKINRN